MNKHLLEIPSNFETERLILRSFQAGDGLWYYAIGRKNRDHLRRYESGNLILSFHSAEEAEVVVRDIAAEWQACNCFFLAGFDKQTSAFVAQIYIGPVSWELPEFQIGYFADEEHQGRGYVTEAVKLPWLSSSIS